MKYSLPVVIGALGILTATTASATEYSGTYTITAIRSHTTKHATSTVNNTSIVLVTGGTLSSGCTGFWLPTANGGSVDANSATVSVLISALLAGKTMTIYYRDDLRAPWGDQNLCAITGAQINK